MEYAEIIQLIRGKFVHLGLYLAGTVRQIYALFTIKSLF